MIIDRVPICFKNYFNLKKKFSELDEIKSEYDLLKLVSMNTHISLFSITLVRIGMDGEGHILLDLVNSNET